MSSEGKLPLLKQIEAKLCKAKSEPGEDSGSAVVKVSEISTPSPSKKLATEYEKKIKEMTGDTRLVKDFKMNMQFSPICDLRVIVLSWF